MIEPKAHMKLIEGSLQKISLHVFFMLRCFQYPGSQAEQHQNSGFLASAISKRCSLMGVKLCDKIFSCLSSLPNETLSELLRYSQRNFSGCWEFLCWCPLWILTPCSVVEVYSFNINFNLTKIMKKEKLRKNHFYAFVRN